MEPFERFLRYVKMETTSDSEAETCPSTEGQRIFSASLAEELRALGLSEVRMDDHGYVYASIPATPGCETLPAIGWIAHVDTADDCSGKNVRPTLVPYSGGDVPLSEDGRFCLRAEEQESLAHFVGQTLIVTDGSTLLGADDKAGVAEIVSAAEILLRGEHPHGKVCLAFTPDEEIGRGADRFDLKTFGADYAYTVDGGELGEMEYECFNAANARLHFQGVSIHPGNAKGKMKNAALMAVEFASLLPQAETPAQTEGYEGFYHLCGMKGDVENAWMGYIIRDHDKEQFIKRKAFFAACAEKINRRYGKDSVTLDMTDSYYNMQEKMKDHMEIVQAAKEAMRELGIEPIIRPIRGGTDGAKLSFMGLPCPNLCTGGMNAHSRYEFVSVEALAKVRDLIVRITETAARNCMGSESGERHGEDGAK